MINCDSMHAGATNLECPKYCCLNIICDICRVQVAAAQYLPVLLFLMLALGMLHLMPDTNWDLECGGRQCSLAINNGLGCRGRGYWRTLS